MDNILFDLISIQSRLDSPTRHSLPPRMGTEQYKLLAAWGLFLGCQVISLSLMPKQPGQRTGLQAIQTSNLDISGRPLCIRLVQPFPEMIPVDGNQRPRNISAIHITKGLWNHRVRYGECRGLLLLDLTRFSATSILQA
jgi:hypothetical protein